MWKTLTTERVTVRTISVVLFPADVETGKAIFAQDPPGQIHEMTLPRQARLRKEDGSFEEVLVVQAEKHSMSDDVIVGYRSNGSGEGVALLSEIDFD